ncbi:MULTISPECIES: phage baseplate assembly protein V [unclassified Clostridium]|uniref:phage baseplate assembly protein V n=1 Tax=unclassified Clostridium TaxID=2614128 RepID=UPI00029789F8|nr:MULTISPECIES: phage baseplate assembly protein V [unclassified Clostridium]EKQ50992.1 MAG: Phage late control D protein (GPD) [Clostridium sp. Maddingley MBC34-26]
MSEEYVYTYGDFIVSPYKFEKIKVLKITRELNEHAKLYINGVISDESADKYVEEADDEASIKISVKDNEGNVTDLFEGIISNIGIDASNDVRTLEVEALSKTVLMDIEKKSRTFQNENDTYEDIFKKINSEYSSAQIYDNATNGANIDKLIVQYKETNWELIKRLASHFNIGVVAECQLSDIKYSLGASGDRSIYDINEYNYSVKKGLHEYKVKAANENYDLDDLNLVSYEITSNKIMNLYSNVNFQGRNVYVYKCEIEMIDGELLNKYILRDEKGMKVRKIYNNKIVGMSLNGSILETKNDVVKIKLEIDGNQDAGTAKWFEYSTVYSSEDGTGWYCMPEVGDAVRLYFPDNEEKNAYAISSVNLESSNSEKRSNPDEKNIGTKYGKQIVMKPGAVEIVGGGNLLMRLTDDGGIEVNSDKKIILSAQDDIEINCKSKITIQGDEGINLTQAGANMNIQDDVTMGGAKVKVQ